MKIRKTWWLLPLALLLAGVCVIYPVAARSWQRHRRTLSQGTGRIAPYQTNYEAKDWQEKARAFDRNKATAATILTRATRIEAYRLFTQDKERPLGSLRGFSFYRKVTVPEPPFRMRLATLLLEAKSYRIPGHGGKLCILEPGAGFRVWQNREFVDVIICFGCNQLAVVENNPKVPMNSIGTFQERFYVAGDFDEVRPQLLALVKEALPEDAAFQNQ